MKLELMAYEKDLTYVEEHYLDKRKQRLDLLIIKNSRNLKIGREICSIFDKFNIIEYKSPGDGLDLGDFYKTISYACLYLKEKHEYDRYGRSAFTVTLIRQERPTKMLAQLRRDGLSYKEAAPGILILDEAVPFKTQIIVAGELSKEYPWLTKLTREATETDIREVVTITEELSKLKDSRYMDYASTVMTVLGEANEELVRHIKEGDVNMNDFWKRIFADEMEEQSKKYEEQSKELAKERKENSELKKTIESLRAELAKQSSKSALL